MKIKKLLKNLDGIIAGITLSVTAVVTIINVILRYVFSFGIPWAQEVTVTCFSWSVMLGMSYAYKHNMHWGIDFLVTKLPEKARWFVYVTIYTILLIGCSILTYFGIQISINGWFKVTAYFQMPYTYKYLSAAMGFFLMCVYSLQYLYLAFYKKKVFNHIIIQGGEGLAGSIEEMEKRED